VTVDLADIDTTAGAGMQVNTLGRLGLLVPPGDARAAPSDP